MDTHNTQRIENNRRISTNRTTIAQIRPQDNILYKYARPNPRVRTIATTLRQQQQIQPMQIMSHFAAIRITPSNVVVSEQPVAPHRVPTALPGFGCVRNLCDLYAHLTRRQTDTEKHKICAGFYMDRLTQIDIHTSITLHDTKRKTCAQIELMFCDQIIYHIKQSVCVCVALLFYDTRIATAPFNQIRYRSRLSNRRCVLGALFSKGRARAYRTHTICMQ